jgi:hypothetical protein
MGYKYVKIDENGKKVTTHQHDEGAVSYATQKYKDSYFGEYITRTITYSSTKGGRTNRFDIDNSRTQGAFIVSWNNVHIAPRPSETKDGVISLDYRVDFIINVKLGEFQRLQDAELYAIKFALDFKINSLAFFGIINQFPLVQHDHDRATGCVNSFSKSLILCRDSLSRINNK